MRGNSHVRFLEGKAVVIPLTYSTLNNLQKIRDGEPLGGRSRAEDDFADEEEEDFLS